MSQAANPYAAPAAQLAPGHKQCDTCGADILARAEICPKCGVRQHKSVSKTALLLLTFFLGGIGAHKFYLGKNWQGVFYLLFFWTYIPGLIALIEFIVYAFTSEERLNEKYSAEGSVAAIVIVAVLAGVVMIGILAAIAIPAYSDYQQRARVSEAIVSVSPWRVAVTEYYLSSQKMPNDVADFGNNALLPAAAGRYSSVSLGPNGVLTLTMSQATQRAAGKTIVFQPEAAAGNVRWSCAGGTLEPRYRPVSCRP